MAHFTFGQMAVLVLAVASLADSAAISSSGILETVYLVVGYPCVDSFCARQCLYYPPFTRGQCEVDTDRCSCTKEWPDGGWPSVSALPGEKEHWSKKRGWQKIKRKCFATIWWRFHFFYDFSWHFETFLDLEMKFSWHFHRLSVLCDIPCKPVNFAGSRNWNSSNFMKIW